MTLDPRTFVKIRRPSLLGSRLRSLWTAILRFLGLKPPAALREGEHRVGAVASPSPTPSGGVERQAVFEVSGEMIRPFTESILGGGGDPPVGWPSGVLIVDFLKTRTGDAVALVQGDDPALPWDGALVGAIFGTGKSGTPFFVRFDLRLGRYAA